MIGTPTAMTGMPMQMPGMAPFQGLSPQLLAAAAAAAFHPPQLPQAPGMGMPSGGGGDGMAGLGAALMGMGGAGMGMGRNPAQKPAGMPAPNKYGVQYPEATQSAYPGDSGSFQNWWQRNIPAPIRGLFGG